MTRIVITCLNPFENRGVEALGISVVQGLIDQFDDPHITVLTNEPELTRKSLPQDCVHFVADDATGPANSITDLEAMYRRAKRALRRDILGKVRPTEKVFAEADIVLISGGDTFSSTYQTAERYLWQLEYPIKLGVPVMFLASSIGIFDTPEEEQRFSARGKKCHFTVREPITRDYLSATLGIDPARVTMTTDPAFLLKPSGPEILTRYGLEPKTYATCVTSRGIAGFKGISNDDHVSAWINAINALLEKVGKVVLVPHVQTAHSPSENDLFLAQEIAAKMEDPRVVVMDDTSHSSQDFKAVLGGAVFNVAERTHGAIGGMSMGVPTLSIGYSIKAEGILRQLVPDDALFAKCLVPVTDFLPDNSAAVTMAAWDCKDEMALSLAQTLPGAKERSAQNYQIAADLIKARRG